MHFYSEHFKQKFHEHDWITGRIPVEEMKHEHTVEYELEFGKNKGEDK
jgi:hypothetical protein